MMNVMNSMPTLRPQYPPINSNIDTTNIEPENSNAPNKIKLVHLSIIITLSFFTAIAWNEAIRYYIGRSIKFYNGQAMYYIYYASFITFLALVCYLYIFLK